MAIKKHPGIYKEHNGKWRITTTFTFSNGEKKYITQRGISTLAQADAILKQLKKQYLISDYKNQKNEVSIFLIVDKYFTDNKDNMKITTFNHKRLIAKKYYLKEYGDYTIDEFINESNLSRYRLKIIDLSMTTNQKNKIIRLLRQVIEHAYQLGTITKDQFKITNIILTPIYDSYNIKKQERIIWTQAEYHQFLSVIPKDDRYHVLFWLWGYIGARIGEIRALQVKHIDLEKRLLTIEQQATNKAGQGKSVIITTKSKASNRTIDISADLCDQLKEYINILELKKDDYLFFAYEPTNPLSENAIRHAMDKYCKLASVINITPHGIRHSNTTWLLSGELSLNDIAAVSRRLGHSGTTITLNVYHHINKSQQLTYLSQLDFLKSDKI